MADMYWGACFLLGLRQTGLYTQLDTHRSQSGQVPVSICSVFVKGDSLLFLREGDWRAFSFYEVEAKLDWIHSLPPRRWACVQLGTDS